MKAVALACVLTLSACAQAVVPAYYLLPAPASTERLTTPVNAIAVREISLPLYARAVQIAALDNAGAVALSDDHRWADEPQRAATSAIVAALSDTLGVRVVAEPWPAAEKPDLRVDITVDRFIGAVGATLELTGRWRVIATAPDRLDKGERFDITVPVGDGGYQALAQAHSAALGELSLEIARAIVGNTGA